jgi:virginiamycin B lyase
MKCLLSVTAAALFLAACSAAGTPTAPVAPDRTGSKELSSTGPARATIRIRIPRRHAKTGPKTANYVSPATRSIAIAIAPAGGGAPRDFNADLTPQANPNCTTAPLVCAVDVTLPPGKYVASFATYDGPLAGGNGRTNPPTGHELSANQDVALTLRAGNANSINVTLGGVPAAVAMVPSPTSTLAGNMTAGFTLSKCAAPQTVDVYGVDADGNYILGPGAPLPSLVSDDPAHIAVAPPAPASPNAFTLSRPNIANANTIVHLTASATPNAPSGGSLQSAVVPVTFNSDVCGALTEFSIPTKGSFPSGIASGPDDALWFTECNGNNIGRITTSGTFSEFPIPTAASQPLDIAAGPGGALWFTEYAGNKIGRITTGGTITEAPTPGVCPDMIAAGPDNIVAWFTDFCANKVGNITTAMAVTEYPTTGSELSGITAGPDAAMWFSESFTGAIARMNSSGTVTNHYTVPTGGSFPFGITLGPDRALWFTENGADRISRITSTGVFTETKIPTGGSSPAEIVAGPDGALWFTECIGNKIGRITTAGGITEYSLPSATSAPDGIAVGADGAIWFTEAQGNRIGRLQ